MNNINRAVVKQQAKDIIKGKIFYLFLITFIVSLLANINLGGTNLKIPSNDFELFRKNDSSSSESYNNDNYSQWNNPIEDFEFNSSVANPEISELSVHKELAPLNAAVKVRSGLSVLVGVLFYPLIVTLAGMYLSLVRRNPQDEFNLGTELGGIFKNSFNDTYLKKLLLVVLTVLITIALALLFIVPGIVFYYSAYFSRQIMSDNPNLKPSEAIKLSKKMIKGNRTELFVLDLSFVGWFLLSIITCFFGFIYVLPYYNTTKALYYENFRMRALQQGRITTDDFISFDEKVSQYSAYTAANNNTGNNYYSYANPDVNTNESEYYYSPQTDNQQTVNADEPVAENIQNDESLNEPLQENGFSSEQDNIE